MSMDPGLDQHEWVSRFESIEEDLRDDPRGSLTNLRMLVEEMLQERGYDPNDPVTREGDDPEVISTFLSAREIALRADAEDVDASDVGEAIHGFTAVYDYLTAERNAP